MLQELVFERPGVDSSSFATGCVSKEIRELALSLGFLFSCPEEGNPQDSEPTYPFAFCPFGCESLARLFVGSVGGGALGAKQGRRKRSGVKFIEVWAYPKGAMFLRGGGWGGVGPVRRVEVVLRAVGAGAPARRRHLCGPEGKAPCREVTREGFGHPEVSFVAEFR